MALPVTITGLSTVVPISGPFKLAAGDYSVIALDHTITSPVNSNLTGLGTVTAKGLEIVNGGAPLTITSVSFVISKTGAPTDNHWLEITQTNPGTNVVLATSDLIAASSVTNGATMTYTFASPATISAGASYGIVWRRAGGSGTDCLGVACGTGTVYSWGLNGTVWTQHSGSPWAFKVNGNFNVASDRFYFFGRDGTTATTLQAYKSTAPDTSWSSVATKTGFTTAILTLTAYQVGTKIHILVGDGTASTSFGVKYTTFDALTDTFQSTIDVVSPGVAVTGQIAGAGAGASLVVRSNGEAVAFFSYTQTKTSGTFRARVQYAIRRLSDGIWATTAQVDSNTAVDNNMPVAVLGAADRVHLVWGTGNGTGHATRTLSAANALSVISTGATLTSPGDGVSYDRSGTTKVVVTSNAAGQSLLRFDSSDNPTPIGSTSIAQAVNATLPHRIGVDLNNDDVTIVYRNSADGDLYAIKSSNDGQTWGTATSFFVGTVASADASASRNPSGGMYQRGSNFVIGYVVNDSGTLKYNENILYSLGITGTLGTTEPADVAALTGAGDAFGPFAVTELADTAAATGLVGLLGPLAVTEAKDVAAATGLVGLLGPFAVTEVADTAAMNGAVASSGTLATTELADTAALTGDVTTPAAEITGTLATTEPADVSALTGLVGLLGTLTVTEAVDTASATGTVVTPGGAGTGIALDPAVTSTKIVLSNSNLTATTIAAGGYGSSGSYQSIGTGKYYAEATYDADPGAGNGNTAPGVALSNAGFENNWLGSGGSSIGYYSDGAIYRGGGVAGSTVGMAIGDKVSIAADWGAKTVSFRNITKAASWSTPLTIALDVGITGFLCGYSAQTAGAAMTFNFDGPFVGTPPDGSYVRWDGSALGGAPAGVTGTLGVTEPADTAALTGSVVSAEVTGTLGVTEPADAASLTGLVATHYTLTATTGAFTIAGSSADLRVARVLQATTGAFAITGYSTSLLLAYKLQAAVGAFAITGYDVNLRAARVLGSSTGAFTITGYSADLRVAYMLQATTGEFVITGYPITMTVTGSYTLAAAAGAFTITGYDINLTRTTAAVHYTLTATAGAFAITGYDINLIKTTAYTLTALPGAFTIAGSSATLWYGASRVLTATPGAFAITGYPIDLRKTTALNYTLTALPGVFEIIGNETGLTRGLWLKPATGSFVVTRNDGMLRIARMLNAQAGAIRIEGLPVDFVRTVRQDLVLEARTGRFEITGYSAGFYDLRVTKQPGELRFGYKTILKRW